MNRPLSREMKKRINQRAHELAQLEYERIRQLLMERARQCPTAQLDNIAKWEIDS